MPEMSLILQEGDIDPLALGMPQDVVKSILGNAEGVYESDDTTIEKRGPFQLRFEDGKLQAVTWLLLSAEDSPFKIAGNDKGSLTKHTSLYNFLDYCEDQGISWAIENSQSFDRQLAIRTCGKVVIIFDLDAQELQRIVIKQ
ncbi:hypothetical protein [Blastopirellula retiformator]|uniref:Uncharacterized protein n=1 Tax=Blastopirellula retiformator TaxID=2527970 RepID=A0A5C5UVK5_9BACT|nr:hypothetical protein [Blastopirellula retiformator]TWT29633.1 hypothetical protein Enr8_48210 [Blastopirellula retiformator]